MTNNFLIDRNILEKIKFDERITQYGHEDTLFGYSLKKKGISISHIDNPVVNGDLEDNNEYLDKTKQGLINLINILRFTDYDGELINDVTILRFYYKVKKIETIVKFIFMLFKPLIIILLSKGFVNLYFFDLYKLGTFIENRQTNLE